MINEKLKSRWRKQAQKAILDLLESPLETDFDSLIFGDQMDNVLENLNVGFPNIEEKPLQKLRAARLKMMGYQFDPESQVWVANSRGRGCLW
ncbi:hypothetical protein [Aliikangiella maris]|uniref:Type II toxin-antitoxin system RelE/ParE family toxin n=2 Tax=Aliikangiella maris TaxID=3162458 RepID=A0ABV2BYH0_9GAMM